MTLPIVQHSKTDILSPIASFSLAFHYISEFQSYCVFFISKMQLAALPIFSALQDSTRPNCVFFISKIPKMPTVHQHSSLGQYQALLRFFHQQNTTGSTPNIFSTLGQYQAKLRFFHQQNSKKFLRCLLCTSIEPFAFFSLAKFEEWYDTPNSSAL